MVYYLKLSVQEARSIPVQLRKWFIRRTAKELEKTYGIDKKDNKNIPIEKIADVLKMKMEGNKQK